MEINHIDLKVIDGLGQMDITDHQDLFIYISFSSIISFECMVFLGEGKNSSQHLLAIGLKMQIMWLEVNSIAAPNAMTLTTITMHIYILASSHRFQS